METLNILLGNPIIALFAILALGLIIGKITIARVSLGSSAVIFVALVFGHLHFTVPDQIGTLGLVLFIYCVGINAGPTFFRAFSKQGATLAKLGVFVISISTLTAFVLAKIFHIPSDLMAGILAGALTSTPALAAATDFIKDPNSLVSVGYGIAYPFGVVGVVCFIQLLPRILKKDLRDLEENHTEKTQSQIMRVFVEVKNPSIIGKEIATTEMIMMASCQVSRVLVNDRLIPIQRNTTFQENQILMLVGDKKNIEMIIDFIGKRSDKNINIEIEKERAEIVVTSPEFTDKPLRELRLFKNFGVTVTRITRAETTFVPTLDTILEQTDRLTIVGETEDLSRFAKKAGHRTRAAYETNFTSLTIGILAGIIVGMMPIALPGNKGFTLGVSGGPLLIGLILGHFGRIGKIVGRIPFAAQYVLRELGLMFFLAHAGVKAGGSLMTTLHQHGITLFFVGAIITIVPLATGYFVATRILEINLLKTLGGLCGSMTSTPGLGTITAKTDSEAPVVSYATAYPVALVLTIIFVQILIQSL